MSPAAAHRQQSTRDRRQPRPDNGWTAEPAAGGWPRPTADAMAARAGRTTADPAVTGEWPTAGWSTAQWVADPRLGGDPARTGDWAAGDWPSGEWRYDPSPSAAPASAPTMPRLLASARPDGDPVLLDEHLAAHGALPRPRSGSSAAAARLIADSGLRGRGGAGFPVAAKVRAVLAAGGSPLLVANGASGDPMTEKDVFLISRLPHLVLDGAQVAAAAIRAEVILLAVADRPGLRALLHRALAERRSARLDPVPVRIEITGGGYLGGESSALAQQLSGRPAVPTSHPPHTAARGVKGRPTLVQNVETLANLALLGRHGVGWFRAAGTPDEPGSMLLTVRGAVPQSVVLEVPLGAPVERALRGAGWLTEPVGAVLVGGCAGRWLPAAVALPAPLSHSGLAAVGGVLGAGVVVALPDRACGLVETARLARYLAAQSARQCGACLNGLPAIAAALTALADGRAEAATVQRLERWCGMVVGRGACRHPDGTAAVVASALRVFADDVARHLGGWCGRPLRDVLPIPDRPVPQPGPRQRA